MKNIKSKLLLAMFLALSFTISNEARADSFRSHHYHRSGPSVYVHTVPVHAIQPARVYPRPVIYRSAYYRSVYQPIAYRTYVRPHYHVGFYEPCYDITHTTGIYWNVGFGRGGWGVNFNTGW